MGGRVPVKCTVTGMGQRDYGGADGRRPKEQNSLHGEMVFDKFSLAYHRPVVTKVIARDDKY